MAKIDAYIPEPKPLYDESNQRQIIASLDTIKNQLNFSFQEDIKQEMQRFTWFMMR
jgi:hypothetical protein